MKQNSNLPNRKTTRKQNWDYGWPGSYFITLVTHNRLKLFGDITDGEMVLSNIGTFVVEEWNKSFDLRLELFCSTFILMPDHLHAIVRIDKENDYDLEGFVQRDSGNSFGVAYRPPKSISSFVAGFKSAITKRINIHRNTPKVPVWQSRFHCHIIGGLEEYERIKFYIINNPKNYKNKKTG